MQLAGSRRADSFGLTKYEAQSLSGMLFSRDFTVYILAPIAGAIIGAGVYKALSSMLPASPQDDD